MKTLEAPPGKTLKPVSKPVFLQRVQWIFDPVGYLESNHQLSPDIFVGTGLGFGDKIVLVSHPDAIQYILTNDRKLFSAPGELNLLLEPLVGDQSIITLSDDRHKRHRQLLMPPFHGERLAVYGDLIGRITQDAFKELNVGDVFSARKVTQGISLQVIFEAVFGLSDGDRAKQIKSVLAETTEHFASPLTSALLFLKFLQFDLGAWSPWGQFVRLRQQLTDLLYAELEERRANPDENRSDILSLLMAARDEDGQPLSDKELRDELMTLLFAGHETTATAMAWALYWLHHKTEIQAKLLAELNSLEPGADPITIAKLPYLTAVCQETLRCTPVAMLTFPREAQEPVELLGYQFPAGTIFMGCMYLTLQREDLYPNPKEFRPERFLERKYTPFEFIPFGNGARRCVGEALALYELKLALATVLTHYQLELVDSEPEVPRRRGVTLAPARGVQMRLLGARQR
ncbi:MULTISPECIES: cytochrome P450 [unclassified Leptolyngbya]|uniref:cytochrome P450 n=1 Tax=unclassified Leptolyngbya TaxID=2650499 RepID=UPI001686B436|nr:MULTISPECIES: cytochrome P450 [unclassified Leptolyngbya]MBD1909373.1 cytochrome P450 [Leptolyngbya sp. FACHB-8]MBD2157608.1 cytochrome P450 [Leptolyngbya sp. FACHB-16]